MNNLSNDIANYSTSNVQIFLYIALPCEAKPLVKHFNLKKETAIQAFAIYQKSNINLTVSGLGKSSMAAAVAYSQALYGKTSNAVFLNIGIAGHRTHHSGEIFCVEKIFDTDTGRNYYPQLVVNLPCPTQSLCTVSKPVNNYPENYLYDMEASAFYQTSTRFSSSELIHCLKVVSDNENSKMENINAQQVAELINNCIETIEKLLCELTSLATLAHYPEMGHYTKSISQWHFSSSNRLILKSLLSQWQAITDNALLPIKLKDCKNSKEFLLKLEKEIERCDYIL
jgi:nucleoside phosphorylase